MNIGLKPLIYMGRRYFFTLIYIFATGKQAIITEEDNMYNIPTINMIKTGEKITELRKKSGLSVRQLQEIFGFATPQAIYKWQQGVTLPAIDNLVVLATLFNVRVEDILVTDETTYISESDAKDEKATGEQ